MHRDTQYSPFHLLKIFCGAHLTINFYKFYASTQISRPNLCSKSVVFVTFGLWGCACNLEHYSHISLGVANREGSERTPLKYTSSYWADGPLPSLFELGYGIIVGPSYNYLHMFVGPVYIPSMKNSSPRTATYLTGKQWRFSPARPRFKPMVCHLFPLVWVFFPLVQASFPLRWAFFPLLWAVFPSLCGLSFGPSPLGWVTGKERKKEKKNSSLA